MAVEFFIGRRYLRAKQKQAFISLITFLSVAGVTVGVMALIIVLAVMAGFEEDLKSRILNVDAHITLKKNRTSQDSSTTISDYREVIKTVGEIPGVESAAPFITTLGLLQAHGYSAWASIRGVDLESPGRVIKYLDTDFLKTNAQRRETDSSIAPGLVLGKVLAQNLGILEGDTVELITSQGNISPWGRLPGSKTLRVVGIFESGLYDYDRLLGFISLDDAQNIQHLGDKVDSIEIRVKDAYHAATIREKIEDALGPSYWASDWIQERGHLFSALELEKRVMFTILTLIVLVAAFNIASTLIMMVMEKKKDIAILKAMGGTDRQIRRIFVFKGMVIGLIGTVLGDSLGVILCLLLDRYQFITLPSDVYFISTLPVGLQPLMVVQVSVAALAICFLATLYPARQASKMNPVEAIRNA